MQDLYSALSVVSTLLSLAGIIGGVLVFRSGLARAANEIQERVIDALENEINILRARLEDLERENDRLERVIVTLIEALKKRGLIVTIEGHLVTVSDGHDVQNVRIPEV